MSFKLNAFERCREFFEGMCLPVVVFACQSSSGVTEVLLVNACMSLMSCSCVLMCAHQFY